jgi:hypothetical protein
MTIRQSEARIVYVEKKRKTNLKFLIFTFNSTRILDEISLKSRAKHHSRELTPRRGTAFVPATLCARPCETHTKKFRKAEFRPSRSLRCVSTFVCISLYFSHFASGKITRAAKS